VPRLVGVDIPKEKRIDIALRYLYGIGPFLADKILQESKIPPEKRAKELSEEEISRLTMAIQKLGYKVEGDLRREVSQNIKRLIDIQSWRGMRHKKGLPVRGQRTRTNSRTRKGPKKGATMLVKK
jgi:small subunit ribosomal protein S13